ncbi:hypothetical protein BREVNS_1314 [Brevinematales bacterium NS]|nr:hypothetical protein BREVNS_1314 [Brevinematales bacterium NS]
MSKEQKQRTQSLEVRFTENCEVVAYSNFALINNSSEEFFFDFGTVAPGKEGVEIFSRVALSPRNAKLFFLALGERVREYEKAFGEIEVEGRL